MGSILGKYLPSLAIRLPADMHVLMFSKTMTKLLLSMEPVKVAQINMNT
jgi:hypothetical protein